MQLSLSQTTRDFSNDLPRSIPIRLSVGLRWTPTGIDSDRTSFTCASQTKTDIIAFINITWNSVARPKISRHHTSCLLPASRDASPDQAGSEQVWVGDHRLPLCLRELLARQSICSDAQGGLWLRMQALHAPIHTLQMEGRSSFKAKVDQYLPDMCATEELLPVLHA